MRRLSTGKTICALVAAITLGACTGTSTHTDGVPGGLDLKQLGGTTIYQVGKGKVADINDGIPYTGTSGKQDSSSLVDIPAVQHSYRLGNGQKGSETFNPLGWLFPSAEASEPGQEPSYNCSFYTGQTTITWECFEHTPHQNNGGEVESEPGARDPAESKDPPGAPAP